jgi:hypothetical protein
MKKYFLQSFLALVILGASFVVKASENDPAPKCKAETGHTLAGYCDTTTEGTAVCVSASNGCDCCHSA